MGKPRPGYVPPAAFLKGFDPRRNMKGRPKGARDRMPRDVHDLLRQKGYRDPLDILGEFANSNTVAPELRIQAAVAMSRYTRGNPPSYRYIDGLTGMSAPTTIFRPPATFGRIVSTAIVQISPSCKTRSRRDSPARSTLNSSKPKAAEAKRTDQRTQIPWTSTCGARQSSLRGHRGHTMHRQRTYSTMRYDLIRT